MHFLQSHEYQPRLLRQFQVVSGELLNLVPFGIVEHVGSSAVPGAISKGDLDIQLGVRAARFNEALSRLEAQGYQVNADSFRSPELCMLLSPQYRNTAVQLVALGTSCDFFVTFRNKLLDNPKLLTEYNQLKLAAAPLDDASYRQVKSAFIEKVLTRELVLDEQRAD
jgi:GrpB-like predicted nucleotidyltransferase (UPF0157 family)